STNRSSSHYHHQDSYDHEWNIDDDFQPLNITDNEVLDESISNRLTNDDEPDDSYITAYQQLIQTQQQQMVAQQEQENMLSTIFEASSPSIPIAEDNYVNDSEEDEEREYTYRPEAPSFASLDEILVSTIFLFI
ncbi:unnamed protein product, partial [Rotaria sordida]